MPNSGDGSFLDKLCIFGNRDATSARNAAAFCRFRKEREWLISSRLDLWLSVIFIKTIPDWLDEFCFRTANIYWRQL